MKVLVNLPETDLERELLMSNVARFHATLMLEKIKKLNYNDASKEKILLLLLEKLNKET